MCQGYHDHWLVTGSNKRDGKGGGWLIYVSVWVGGQGVGINFSIFCSRYVLLLTVLPWLVHERCCVFLCSFSASFFSGGFNQALLVHRICWVCSVKLFQNQVSDHYSVDFLEKGRLLWSQSLFRQFTIFYSSQITFYAKFIFQACWLVTTIYHSW